MSDLADLFSRHEHVALMFSGGRDSLACLHMAEPYWERTTVIWVNTQANFPEIEAVMRTVRELVPRFHEVVTNQPEAVERAGYPTDVLPIDWTALGQSCSTRKPMKLRSYIDCCAENFFLPADRAARELGCTAVIRGQRADESRRGPVTSGHLLDGVEYGFPIEGWSADQVMAYLQARGVAINDRLSMSHSSLDCWSCTAFWADGADRLRYIRKHHPDRYPVIRMLLAGVRDAVNEQTKPLRLMLED